MGKTEWLPPLAAAIAAGFGLPVLKIFAASATQGDLGYVVTGLLAGTGAFLGGVLGDR